MTRRDHYRRIRAERPAVPARWAWDWALTEWQVDCLRDTIDWEDRRGYVVGHLPDGVEIRVSDDEETYDWGDVYEPTDEDRANLEVINVGAGLTDEDTLDVICGVAYLDHDWERAALVAAVEHGLVRAARRELSERAAWAARGVVTVT